MCGQKLVSTTMSLTGILYSGSTPFHGPHAIPCMHYHSLSGLGTVQSRANTTTADDSSGRGGVMRSEMQGLTRTRACPEDSAPVSGAGSVLVGAHG